MPQSVLVDALFLGAFVAVFVALPLWWGLRGAARDHRRPDDEPPDPLPLWMRTAAVLSVFGPFWYPPGIRAGVPPPESIHTKEADPP